jgi:23S rRNA pseudouridine1911/1915/1917 synthase
MDDRMKYTLRVDHLHANKRVDKFIAESLPDFSRSKIQNLIMGGSVTTKNGQVHDCAQKVKEDDVYDIIIPEVTPSHLLPNDIPLDILYEDDDLIVINKQAGLVTHPGAGNNSNTLVNALLAHCGKSLSTIGAEHLRPGIVHRLDKNTSGVIIVAKNDIAHASLALQIQNRELCRQYTAITFGVPKPLSGTIKYNVGRSDKDRTKMAVIAVGGKSAVTHYEVLEILAKGLAAIVKS